MLSGLIVCVYHVLICSLNCHNLLLSAHFYPSSCTFLPFASPLFIYWLTLTLIFLNRLSLTRIRSLGQIMHKVGPFLFLLVYFIFVIILRAYDLGVLPTHSNFSFYFIDIHPTSLSIATTIHAYTLLEASNCL